MTPSVKEERWAEVVERLRCRPQTITFRELKTNLRNHALVNIQARGSMAKPYQCRQVASAIVAMLKGNG